MTDYNTVKNLIEKLAAGYDKEDPDYKAAESDGMIEEIKNLFCECYDAESLLKWLSDHDFDIFVDYRYADKTSFDDIAEELDNGNDSPSGVYGCDLEEWKECNDDYDRKEYIKDHLDCLMCNYDTGVVVISWQVHFMYKEIQKIKEYCYKLEKQERNQIIEDDTSFATGYYSGKADAFRLIAALLETIENQGAAGPLWGFYHGRLKKALQCFY